MSDIVVRLRFWGDSYHLHKESADEIEKLRAALSRAKELFLQDEPLKAFIEVCAALGEKE